MKIKKSLKYADFEYDEKDKSFTIIDTQDGGVVELNKVYAFAFMRFVIRMAQRNWLRQIKNQKKDLDKAEKICDNTKYKNSRIIFSGGQKFFSKAAWQRGIQGDNSTNVIDCPEFWEELNTLKIYNEEQ